MNIGDLIRKVFGGGGGIRPSARDVLTGLPEEYLVINGILYNNNEIHYVVFSRRQGLFIINTAAGRGRVTYNGSRLLVNGKPRSEAVQKVLKDTFWLKTAVREIAGVNAHITSLLVFEEAAVSVDRPILGVRVMEPGGLADAVLHAPECDELEDGVVAVLREMQGVRNC